ncbi:MAG: AAA family ATPase, partial [Succinivibrionaceae bacterium]
MGSILNPIDGNSFVDLAVYKNEDIFVDKTEFIEKMSEHINKNKRFFAVTRPRRFGKTVTAHMLSAYYSKGYAGQNIFEGLKITGKMEDREYKDNEDKKRAEERARKLKASYEKHLNKYDVIYIDMNTIRSLFIGYL